MKTKEVTTGRKVRSAQARPPIIRVLKDHVIVSRKWLDEVLEDLDLLAKVAARKGESKGDWKDLDRKLRKDGVL